MGLPLYPLLALLQWYSVSNPGILDRQASPVVSGAGAQLPGFKFYLAGKPCHLIERHNA